MKRGLNHRIRREIKRLAKQQGQEISHAQVLARKPTGGTGATYSLNLDGVSANEVATMGQDFEPGQSVIVSRHGPGGNIRQILGRTPPSHAATQSEESGQTDVTNAELI